MSRLYIRTLFYIFVFVRLILIDDFMNKKLSTIIFLLSAVFILFAQESQKSTQIYQTDGIYYRDRNQTELYTGDYREYYDNKTLKLEMQIKNGLTDGPYIVYFDNRKPQEVRSYKDGKLHGIWRSYDISGQLISEAEYLNGNKHGTWRIWDELGTQRYEMNYKNGDKKGIWRMWDENGTLVDEKEY